MRKYTVIFTLILLAVTSMNLKAEWTKYGVTDVGEEYLYFESIKRTGNQVKIWRLVDLKLSQDIGAGEFFSARGLVEFNCQAETVKLLALTFFAGHMGQGQIIDTYDYKDADEKPIPPGTINNSALKLACGKK